MDYKHQSHSATTADKEKQKEKEDLEQRIAGRDSPYPCFKGLYICNQHKKELRTCQDPLGPFCETGGSGMTHEKK